MFIVIFSMNIAMSLPKPYLMNYHYTGSPNKSSLVFLKYFQMGSVTWVRSHDSTPLEFHYTGLLSKWFEHTG